MKRILLAALAAVALCASPASAQLRGQVIAGENSSAAGQAKNVAVDSSGRLLVVGSASGSNVYGNDAVNVAPTQAPVLGGCYGASAAPTVVTTGRVQYSWCDLNGRLQITGSQVPGTSTATSGLLVGGFDGTNYRNLTMTAAGTLITTGSFFPGSSGVTSNGQIVGGSDGSVYRNFSVTTGGVLNVQAVGIAPDNGTSTGNPVSVGGVYDSTLPTYGVGNRTTIRTDVKGNIRTLPTVVAAADVDDQSNATLGFMQQNTNVSSSSGLVIYGHLFDGVDWDRQRTIQDSTTSGVGVAAVALKPVTSANAAITPVVSTAAESNHVLKASGGNLYRVTVTSGAVSGYLMVFNATSAPADGAVTPLLCRAVPANTSVEVDHTDIPDRYSTGITVVYSSTGCATKTASATAWFEGSVM